MRRLFVAFLALVSCNDDNQRLTCVCQHQQACIIEMGRVLTDVDGVSVSDMVFVGACKPGNVDCTGSTCGDCVGFVEATDEVCDGVDNDCDGLTDEGFDVDHDGYVTCAGDCNDNDHSIHPGQDDICDNIDNDCDGAVDGSSRTCWTGRSSALRTSPSTCSDGNSVCERGVWGPCLDQVPEAREVCDGLDNDCDGEVDEPIEGGCGLNSVGACLLGDLICTPEMEQVCIKAVYPLPVELCNDVDDDCDGQTDEDVVELCETPCGKGKRICMSGTWSACTARQPSDELCNDVDDDCDGQIDEGCPCSEGDTIICRQNLIDLRTGLPMTCGMGVSICDELGLWGPCYFVMPEDERCDNWDNDCDGVVDGQEQSCGNPALDGVGECRLGRERCDMGKWSPCVDRVDPLAEICDGLDNDCDRSIDEELDPHDVVDMCFFIDGSTSMCSVIKTILAGISTYVDDFRGTDHRFCLGVFPSQIPMSLDEPGVAVELLTGSPGAALVNIDRFKDALGRLDCVYDAWEPSYDAMYYATDPADSLGIGWRAPTQSIKGAYPYVIVVTDEEADSFIRLTEGVVATRTSNCSVGACESGDKFEVFVMTKVVQFGSLWDDVVFRDPTRLIEIYPASETRYVELFRHMFTNVCR